jgi:hypothetical protein
MSCQKDNISTDVLGIMKSFPSFRYLKEPVDDVSQLYERYPDGVERGCFAFVLRYNCFYAFDVISRVWAIVGTEVDVFNAIGGLIDSETNNAITAKKLVDGAVTTAKIADDAVNEDKIANDAVSEYKIVDGSITTDKLNDGAVTAAKIQGGAVTTAKIANGAVTSDKLSQSYFTTSQGQSLQQSIQNVATALQQNINTLQQEIETLKQAIIGLQKQLDW